jgi:hypothetical protein
VSAVRAPPWPAADHHTMFHPVQWLPNGATGPRRGGGVPGPAARSRRTGHRGQERADRVRRRNERVDEHVRAEEEHPLTRDPVDQAKDAADSLLRYLRDLKDWPSRWGPIGYAVCFPDDELPGDPPPHLGRSRSTSPTSAARSGTEPRRFSTTGAMTAPRPGRRASRWSSARSRAT